MTRWSGNGFVHEHSCLGRRPRRFHYCNADGCYDRSMRPRDEPALGPLSSDCGERPLMRVDPSDHYDGRRFVNPSGDAGQPFPAVLRMLREPRTPWPTRVDEPLQQPPNLDGAPAVVTFIGHSTFLI